MGLAVIAQQLEKKDIHHSNNILEINTGLTKI